MADQIPTKDLRKPGGVGSNEPKPQPAPKSPKAPESKQEHIIPPAVSGGMAHINKHILVATVGLVTVGLIKTWNQSNPWNTKVISGGFVVLLTLSVLDMFGGGASKIASGIAMVALVGGVLSAIPADFIANLANAGNPKAKSATTGTQTTKPLGGS